MLLPPRLINVEAKDLPAKHALHNDAVRSDRWSILNLGRLRRAMKHAARGEKQSAANDAHQAQAEWNNGVHVCFHAWIFFGVAVLAQERVRKSFVTFGGHY